MRALIAALAAFCFASVAYADDACEQKCENRISQKKSRCSKVRDDKMNKAAAAGLGSSLGSLMAMRGNRNADSLNQIQANNNRNNAQAQADLASASSEYDDCVQQADDQLDSCKAGCG